MQIQNFIFILFFFSGLNKIFSQQDNGVQEVTKDSLASPFAFEANADIYYRWSNLGRPSLTSMVLKHNTPEVGSINVQMSYDYKKIGALINLSAGPRADQFYGVDNKSVLKYIKQAYVYYAPFDYFKLNVGTSTAMQGFEYDEPCKNPNYSASFLNSYTPANYTGIWAETNLADHFTFTSGIYNDTDRKIDVTPGIHIGGMLAYDSEKLKASISVVNGQEIQGRLTTIDFMAEYNLSASNAFAIEIYRVGYSRSSMTNKFNAINLYIIHQLSENISLCLRNEYFIDNDGVYFGQVDNQITDFTFTAKMKYKNIVIMPELRKDFGRKNIFLNENGIGNKQNFSAILGISYMLD